MRQSGCFLRSALISPQAKFYLFHNLLPLTADPKLCHSEGSVPSHKLLSLSWLAVGHILKVSGMPTVNPEDVFDCSGTMWPQWLSSRHKGTRGFDSVGHCPTLVFLGTEDLTEQPNVDQSFQPTHGSPVWAIDVTALGESSSIALNHQGRFLELKKVILAPHEANLAAQARALLDWNARNKFCAACGRPTYSAWSGWKLVCTSNISHSDTLSDQEDRDTPTAKANCLTKSFGVQNFCYPRTDPVCIVAITNSTEDSILLGRKGVWPPGFYSCLAGFVEPGESIEDCCRREVLEEAGVEVESVHYHSSQPWPFPGSLMIGVLGRAAPDAQIRLDLDNELQDAKFFPRSLILDALDSSKQVELTEEELQRFDDNLASSVLAGKRTEPHAASGGQGQVHFAIPPPTAIAHQLIRSWAMKDHSRGLDNSQYEGRPNF